MHRSTCQAVAQTTRFELLGEVGRSDCGDTFYPVKVSFELLQSFIISKEHGLIQVMT